MPAHISFAQYLKGIQFAATGNASALAGKFSAPGNMTQLENTAYNHVTSRGAYTPGDFTSQMKNQREYERQDYKSARIFLDYFDPGFSAKNHGARNPMTPVAEKEWSLFLRPGGNTDRALQQIFGGSPTLVLFIMRQSDIRALKRIEWLDTIASKSEWRKMPKQALASGGPTKYLSKVPVQEYKTIWSAA